MSNEAYLKIFFSNLNWLFHVAYIEKKNLKWYTNSPSKNENVSMLRIFFSERII